MEDPSHLNLYERFKQSKGISTDTRSIGAGQIFFALKGPYFDANDFAREAIEKGALLAVIDNPVSEFENDEKFIVVDDSLKALQWLAIRYRKEFEIPVIGLTGSNGKTTTRELIHAVLSKKYNSFATPGNLNNHIGVPLSVLQLKKDHKIAVIEMGANHIGEIANLCKICQPTHGIITNVGKDHLEGFGSFEGSLRANSELFQFLIENQGTAFINTSDPIIANMSKRFSEPVTYPGKDDFSSTEFIDANPCIEFRSESGSVSITKLIGKYNFNNIATALCIGKFFSVPQAGANSAVSNYQPKNNRSEWKKTKNNTILLDAYNANPSSMEVAIESFLEMKGDLKAVILGDMFELGEYSEKEHRALGDKLASSNIQKIILCGSKMEFAAEQLSNVVFTRNKKELLQYLQSSPLKNHLILLKGSRGMAMEECLPYL